MESQNKLSFENLVSSPSRLEDCTGNSIQELMLKLVSAVSDLELHAKIEAINDIKESLHEISPFKDEPVDFVKWVPNDEVVANDYNPNKVAPPEMKLLELSIVNDGYTQPIVSWSNPKKGKIEVIDGFHRNRVGKESKVVNQRIQGYLPIVDIRTEQSSKNDRVASTIRHNRARGKHQVDAMSEIVIELKNRNWRNARIARELGMDEEEVLRLCQISGMENLFNDRDFSRAWVSEDVADTWEDLTDQIEPDIIDMFRVVNVDDAERIFHTFDKWECHKHGFYASNVEGKTANECMDEYAEFLRNDDEFIKELDHVISEWKHSCEHYLTNKSMNRIAWLGQAAACYARNLPSKYCSGFNLLSDDEKSRANNIALDALNSWLSANDRDEISLEDGLSIGRQMEIY